MTFPIPNFPTDNLYKFFALSGVFVFIASIWLNSNMLSDLNTSLNEITVEAETATTLRHLLPENIADDYDLRSAEIKLFREFAELSISSQTKLDALIKQQNKVMKFSILLYIVACFGILVSGIGFRQWYLKVQKPLDEILQLNLRKAKSETLSSTENQEQPTASSELSPQAK